MPPDTHDGYDYDDDEDGVAPDDSTPIPTEPPPTLTVEDCPSVKRVLTGLNPELAVLFKNLFCQDKYLARLDNFCSDAQRTMHQDLIPALHGISVFLKGLKNTTVIRGDFVGPSTRSRHFLRDVALNGGTFGEHLRGTVVYSHHSISHELSWFRKSGNIAITCNRLIEKDVRQISGMPITYQSSELTIPIITVGSGYEVCILTKNGSAPRNSLPGYITDVLPPVSLYPMEMEKTIAGFAQGVSETGYPSFLNPGSDSIRHALNELEVQFSSGLLTPICFTHALTATALADVVPEEQAVFAQYAEATKMKALRIHKLRGEFELVEITLATYLDNPNQYIVVLDVPKHVQFLTSDYLKRSGIGIEVITELPTLMIPQGLLTSTSKRILESAYLIIDHLNRKSLSGLVDSSKYKAAVALLESTTAYWDGALRVLDRSEPTQIKKLLNEYDNKRKVKPITSDCDSSNGFIKSVLGSQEYNNISKIAYSVGKLSRNLDVLSNSIDRTKRTVYTVNTDLENTRHKLQNLEEQKMDLDEQWQTMREEHTDQLLKFKQENEDLNRASTLLKKLVPSSTPSVQDLYLERLVVDYKTPSGGKSVNVYIDFNKIDDRIEFTCEKYPMQPDNISNIFKYAPKEGAALIEFQNTYDAFGINSVDFHVALAKMLASSNASISKLVFQTKKPVRIYVDNGSKPREKCQIVVGGPYAIHLALPTMIYSRDAFSGNQVQTLSKMEGRIFLADKNAVFGTKKMGNNIVHLKQHPHSKEFPMDTAHPEDFLRFIEAPTAMCFGDSEKSLIAAGEAKNIEQIKQILLAWTQSAWSNDDWGKSWFWFPKPEQVDLDGNFNKLRSLDPVATERSDPVPVPAVIDSTADTDTDTDVNKDTNANAIPSTVEEVNTP